jgi:hypothetical protein
MNRKARRVLGAILLLSLGSTAAISQTGVAAPATAPETLEAGLARLNGTMERLTAMVEELLRRQQADLLMQRIQLATRGLTELERGADSARQELESLARDRARIEEEIARVDAATDEEPQPGMPGARERREMKLSMERELRFLEDRRTMLESRVLELENQLLERHDDLAVWEALVDKALGIE